MAWDKTRPSANRTSTAEHKARRRRVLKRDKYQCQIKGATCLGTATICDHIVALALGGEDTDENCQAACSACHQIKTNAEAIEGLRRRSPRRKPMPHPGHR